MNVIKYLLKIEIIKCNWQDRKYMDTVRDKDEEKKYCKGINIIFIGHPTRHKQELIIDNEKYNISFDGFNKTENNEDPFIWNENFLYSFCHANHALSKEIRQLINEKEEVYFVFVAKTAKDSDIFEIDTVIKAEEIYEWPPKNKRFKENLCNPIFNEKVIKYHLPYLPGDGTISEHDNVNLYTCVGNADGSFLPMVKSGDQYIPYQFNSEMSEYLLDLLKSKNSNRYYVAKESSKRLSDKHKKFEKVSNKVKILIMKEHISRNRQLSNKRFLKGCQIFELYNDLRNTNDLSR